MKRRRQRFALLILLAAAFAAAPSSAEPKSPAAPVDEFYAYDQKLPLLAQSELEKETDLYKMYKISFRSAHDKRVPGIFAVPKAGEAPYPVILWQHGLFNNKENHFERAGETLLKNGYAVLMIDAELHGERKSDIGEAQLFKLFYAFRDMMTQTTIDLKRAADFLETRDEVDMHRFAYVGVSLGSFMGSAFMAQDKRPKAGVMIVGGTVEDAFAIMKMEKEYKRIHPVIEPKNFIGRVSPRPLLFLNANNDVLISRQAALNFFEAAGEPKRQIFYDAGHVIPMEMMEPELIPFLDEQLKR